MKYKIFIFTISLFVLLSACSGGSSTLETDVLPADTDFLPTGTPILTPELDKATVNGNLISIHDGELMPDTAVWLAEIVRQNDQAVYILDSVNSPGIYSDPNGIFVISNLDPGEYVIVVGEPEGQYKIITESSGVAKVWNFPANVITDVGELIVDLDQ